MFELGAGRAVDSVVINKERQCKYALQQSIAVFGSKRQTLFSPNYSVMWECDGGKNHDMLFTEMEIFNSPFDPKKQKGSR